MASPALSSDAPSGRDLAKRAAHPGEAVIAAALWSCAAISVAVTIGIVCVLVLESRAFFAEVSIVEFLTGTEWHPRGTPPRFGILPLFCGTLLTTAGAAILAVPIGLGTAVFLSEYAPPRLREIVKPTLEILAGIPSVVYGFFALAVITPAIKQFIPSTDLYNAASASIVVGVMILPMISSFSEDVLRAVPRSLRDASMALGADKFHTTVFVVLPAAASGVVAAVLLAIARAVGETMAVTLAAGSTPRLTLNPFQSVQTMTAYIASVSQGEASVGSIEYRTIFAVGLALFVCTMLLNLVARAILARMREQYE